MAVSTLAIGVGLNVAIFSVIEVVLLRPLPFPAADRLVLLARSYPDGRHGPVSVQKFLAWRDSATWLESLAAHDFAGGGLNLTGGDSPELVRGIRVSIDFFRALGATPAMGRTFAGDEDRPRGPRTAVLSNGLWQRRFGGDRAVVGRRISLNEDVYTVVGVMPADFRPDTPADVWLPLQADPATTNLGQFLKVVARLPRGMTLQAANERLRAVGEQFRRVHPDAMGATETVRAYPLRDELVGELRRPLLVLAGAVAFVLLIACVNVAALLLARVPVRRREIAVRLAVGASRAQVVGDLLVESAVLAAAGSLAGLLLGAWAVRLLVALGPPGVPHLAQLVAASSLPGVIDWRILAFTGAVAVSTLILFGTAPALVLSRWDLSTLLAGGRPHESRRWSRERRRDLLVVAEVALALVLVSGATLLVRTLVALGRVDPGLTIHDVLTTQVSLAGRKYDTAAATERYEREATLRLEALPGVAAAAQMLILPLLNDMDMPFVIDGRPLAHGDRFHGDEFWRYVGPHYFRVFEIPARRGRVFDDRDGAAAGPVAVVNESFARKYWPRGDALGSRVVVGKGMGELEDVPREIVGIVRDTHEAGLQRPVRPVLYVPESQLPDGYMRFGHDVVPLTWAVRAAGDPARLASAARAALLAADGSVPPAAFQAFEDVVAETTRTERFMGLLLTLFGSVGLVLAAVGVYGAMACRVAARTREIAVRIAVGAQPERIVRSFLGNALGMALLGAVVGVSATLGLSRLVRAFLFGVSATDTASLVFTVALIVAVTALAGYVPARRASRVDPVMTLRDE